MSLGNNNGNDKKNDAPRGPRSFRDLNSMFFQELNPTHSELEHFQTLLAEVLKRADPACEIRLVPIFDDQLALPALAVLVSKKSEPEKGVGYHLVIIETEEWTQQVHETGMTYQGQTVMIEHPAGAVFDRTYADIARRVVTQALMKPQETPLFDGGARVLHHGVKLEDPVVLHHLAYSIVSAASGQLFAQLGDSTELDLSGMESSNQQLKTDYNPPARSDVMQMPIRRDVVLTLETRMSPRPEHRPFEIGTVAGFVDVIPVEDKKFLPRFVITQIEPGRGGPDLVSLQMLLLATATVMTEDRTWQDALVRPNLMTTPAKCNRLEHFLPNYSEAILSQDATTAALWEVMLPQLVFSMDVANASSDTWRLDPWAAAAHGEQGANRFLLETAERLCGGRFSQYFPNHGQIVMTENNPIPLGYYMDYRGERADIRDLDQLMVRALTFVKDPRFSDEWAQTYMDQSIPEMVRVAKRKQMIRSILGNVHFTDTATRVTFTAEFIHALRQGVRDVGFSVSIPKVQAAWTPSYPFATTTSVRANESGGLFREPFNGMSQGGRNRWQ